MIPLFFASEPINRPLLTLHSKSTQSYTISPSATDMLSATKPPA
jgi:hypothetical protein